MHFSTFGQPHLIIWKMLSLLQSYHFLPRLPALLAILTCENRTMLITCSVAYCTDLPARSHFLRKSVITNTSCTKRHILRPQHFILQADFQLSQFTVTSNTNGILHIKTFKNLASNVRLNSYLEISKSRLQFPTQTVSSSCYTHYYTAYYSYEATFVFTQNSTFTTGHITLTHTTSATSAMRLLTKPDETEIVQLRLIDS
jgi:hypothetical protein